MYYNTYPRVNSTRNHKQSVLWRQQLLHNITGILRHFDNRKNVVVEDLVVCEQTIECGSEVDTNVHVHVCACSAD